MGHYWGSPEEQLDTGTIHTPCPRPGAGLGTDLLLAALLTPLILTTANPVPPRAEPHKNTSTAPHPPLTE